MIKIIRWASMAAALALVAGCAHKIDVSPEVTSITAPAGTTRINATAAYYISPEDLARTVTTPGGGGDKVSYQPYKDIETAFYKMLSNVFSSVSRLKQAPAAGAQDADVVLTPSMVTNSSSPSPFTWPPTVFNVQLTTTVADRDNRQLGIIKAEGEGKAEYDEFIKNFGLSGRRAMEDAVLKTQAQLLQMPELQKK
ncbi:hypothetical protein [Bordetella genomosp. 13]|uniref:hypothetical protein n=1 Tax=Bordetella genomosp. 13 TaxID=463040 RepID=UPI0011A797CE|nr:hypothetical protein [Bordetella genomosp. 13]